MAAAKKSTGKSCLVVSYGPVPTPEFQTIEGGGLRAWGLAQGLKANGVDVTVSVNASFPQTLTEHEGIRLTNWQLDADFIQQLNSFDAVIASYCMGDPSVFIADNLTENVQLILDAYVPIYIEVPARDSKDVEGEYAAYMGDIVRFNHVLKRGDFFLYANSAQELLYSGVLASLGVINPRSYREKRLIHTPFGVLRTPAVANANPYADLGIGPNDFVVLWFSGIYPWFHIEEYLDAIRELSKDRSVKFVFAGGKNPFNPNPDFSLQYDKAVAFAEQHKLLGKTMFFVDWVDFNQRINWFKHAGIVISLNKAGNENKFAWRTRVIDFVWGEVVTLSNGGDPLSDEMLEHHAAIHLPELSASALVKTISDTKKNPGRLAELKANVTKLKQKYFWDIVTKEVSEIINSGDLPYAREQPFRQRLGLPAGDAAPATPSGGRRLNLIDLPFKVVRKIKQKGVVRTAKIAASVIRTQVKNRASAPRPPQFVFISNPINNTGAPVVLLQIIEEYVRKYGANRVWLVTPGVDQKHQAEYLRKLGVRVDHAVFGIGFRFIRLQLGLQKDDVVFMNTVAIYDTYRDFVLLWLRNGRLRHAYWFIHEDIAQLPVIHKEFLEKHNLQQIAALVTQKSLTLLFPSRRTAAEYRELIGTPDTHPINLRVEVPAELQTARTVGDFDHINFLLSGTSTDGRKGQLIALSAFQSFLKGPYSKSPDQYRPFKLHLVAVGRDDYVSQQVRWIAESTLGDRVVLYDSLPKDRALDVTADCNAVICCSLNETFGLYVAEGMLMGHVVLRNNSAGVDEQLRDGRNGYLVDHTDVEQFAGIIEKILNKRTNSNRNLQKMSQTSQKMMRDFTTQNYIDQIDAVTEKRL